MIVGGYTLHLYCRNEPGCSRAQRLQAQALNACGEFYGRDGTEAWTLARKAGWRRSQHDVLCPECAARTSTTKGRE